LKRDDLLALAREAEPKIIGPDQAAWLNRLDVEHDNLRTAIDWGLADPDRRADGLTLATRFWWFWTKRGYFTEGQQRLERALGSQEQMARDLEAPALIAVLRKHGDIWSPGILLTDLAELRVLENRHADARACKREAMSLTQSIRDRRGLRWCLQAIAMLQAAAGRARRAAWLHGAGEAMLEGVGAVGQSVVTQVQDRYLTPARLAIEEDAFRNAANEGRASPFARIMDMDPRAFASA
jgi:hypothetical protein